MILADELPQLVSKIAVRVKGFEVSLDLLHARAVFLDHLYGWQDDTYGSRRRIAEEEDLAVERI